MGNTATFSSFRSGRERAVFKANKRANDHLPRAGDVSNKHVGYVSLKKGTHEMTFFGHEMG
jgi:hypothetical protein